jgi:hypothetical protein
MFGHPLPHSLNLLSEHGRIIMLGEAIYILQIASIFWQQRASSIKIIARVMNPICFLSRRINV